MPLFQLILGALYLLLPIHLASSLSHIIRITLSDQSQSRTYTLPVTVLPAQQNSDNNNPSNQIRNDTQETDENIDIHENLVKCIIKAVKVTQTGVLTLQVTSLNRKASESLANALNESDIQVSLSSSYQIKVKITEVDGVKVTVQMELQGSDSQDIVEVRVVRNVTAKVKEGSYARLQKGSFTMTQLPLQITKSQEQTVVMIQQTSNAVSITFFTFGLIFSLLLQIIMNQIWGLLNDLSFLVSLSMVSLSIPGIAQPIQSAILQFIYLDIFMTDKWLPSIADRYLTQEELDEDGAVNGYFEGSGFGSRYMQYNLGSTLIFMGIYAGLLVAIGVMQPFAKRYQRVQKVSDRLKERLMWSGTIRFIIQQYQPLLISSLLHLSSPTDHQNASTGVKFSYNLAISTIALLGLCLLAFTFILQRSDVTTNDFLQKYSPLTDCLNPTSNILALNWITITLIKWSLMSLSLTLLRDYPAQQLQCLSLLSLLSLALQTHAKPQLHPTEQSISLFNELMACLYLCIMPSLMFEHEKQEQIGIALLSVIVMTFGVNLGKVVYCVVREVYKRVRLSRKLRKQSQNVVKMQPIENDVSSVTDVSQCNDLSNDILEVEEVKEIEAPTQVSVEYGRKASVVKGQPFVRQTIEQQLFQVREVVY
ncbi:hypothetical protein FGO68_gene13700 [Halteria grandinella]|uniref:TRP C-terminal domain-containing protein n=1 Tax=Halteria grandinella TaxID=5974 RepID=A0A8J8P3T1_HALGN|nr:hypothetical protein FGO68_gene13700 [Halteria grandinella]